MDARDVFGIIVRTVGLLAIIHGLPGLQGMMNPPEGYGAANYLMSYGLEVIGGLVLLLGAGPIVWLSYLGVDRYRGQRES